MYFIAFFLLFVLFLWLAIIVLCESFSIIRGKSNLANNDFVTAAIKKMEISQIVTMTVALGASFVLVIALLSKNYSIDAVRNYTDNLLPLFYRLTAFWAGQDGSFLFWFLCIAISGGIFVTTAGYNKLPDKTKYYFWICFFGIELFFLYVLIGTGNPFSQTLPAPFDGSGLNPLLQHPGMIFHPPLLFMGYALFTIPACLAIASCLNGDNKVWIFISKNWILVSWATLTAGILLGSWWSYMELGWGGYWAWDPVENASLIPWLTATAFIHISLLSRMRDTWHRFSVFLCILTLILCFYGTFIVRSGIIESLHAFGGSTVALPLGLLMSVLLVFGIFAIISPVTTHSKPVDSFFSRSGMLFIIAVLLLILAAIVFGAVNFPLVSAREGLGVDFYNKVCMPLFAVMVMFLPFCPWMSWKNSSDNKLIMACLCVISIIVGVVLYFQGVTNPVALLGAVAGTVTIASVLMIFLYNPKLLKVRRLIGAYGVHLGVAMIAIGIAFSGPYQKTEKTVLQRGMAINVGEYTFKYEKLEEGNLASYSFQRAILNITQGGKFIGILQPERRIYKNFANMQFMEASTIPGMRIEFYASLLHSDEKGFATLQISLMPMVNWIWMGSIFMSLFVFLCFQRIKKEN